MVTLYNMFNIHTSTNNREMNMSMLINLLTITVKGTKDTNFTIPSLTTNLHIYSLVSGTKQSIE